MVAHDKVDRGKRNFIKFLFYFTDNTFGKIVATLPFILAWFNLDVKGGTNCHNIYYGYYY